MFDSDKWIEIFHTLTKNPLRTLLTALGVFWGIFLLVIILGASKGLENGVTRGFDGIAKNSLFLWSQRTSKPYQGLPAGRSFTMNNDDFYALKEAIEIANVITPRNQLGGFREGNQVNYKNKSATFSIYGDYPEVIQVEAITVKKGRFLNLKDLMEKRKVAVIGDRVKEILFEEEEPIGKYIKIQGVYFQVVGLFDSKSPGEQGIRETERIYIPFSTFQQAFNYGHTVSWFTMTAKEGVRSAEVKDKALTILKKRHRVHPEDERAFGYFNLEEEYLKVQNLFLGIRGISWIVGILTLFSGVIGVSNIMLVIVKERTKEIGIRRAIGAKPLSVITQIMSESIILTFLAGLMGLIIGILVLEGINYFLGVSQGSGEDMMFMNPSIRFTTAIYALGIMTLAGAFAGVMPARRAVRISPVEALRAD